MDELFVVFLSLLNAFLDWLKPFSPIIQLVSYIFGPILAILAFRYNRQDRRALLREKDEAVSQRERANHARQAAELQEQKTADALKQVADRKKEIDQLEADIERLTKGASTVWKIRTNEPYPEYRNWSRDPKGAQFLAFGNLKGGVGKTTLASNYAAYCSEILEKKVLLVDLDFQGSLTQSVLLAAGIEETGSKSQNLFANEVPLTTFEMSLVHVAPLMCRTWLVPSSYEFAERENQMMWEAVQRDQEDVDVRYRLAHALHRPEVRRRFDIVIFDLPPRMSLGTVNALIASHWLLVPTVLDKLSAEAVPRFLSQMSGLKSDLDIDLRLAGIVGVMHRVRQRSDEEELTWSNLGSEAEEWLNDGFGLIEPTLPRRQAFPNSAGEKLTILEDAEVRDEFLVPIFFELSQRIGLISRQSSDQSHEDETATALN